MTTAPESIWPMMERLSGLPWKRRRSRRYGGYCMSANGRATYVVERQSGYRWELWRNGKLVATSFYLSDMGRAVNALEVTE